MTFREYITNRIPTEGEFDVSAGLENGSSQQLIRLESPPYGYRTPEDTFVAFEVPKDWLMAMLDFSEDEGFRLNVFLDMYTDDDATEIYNFAMREGVIKAS